MLFIFIAFCVFTSIQLIYYAFIFSKFNSVENNTQKELSFTPPISVLVCAKNEAKNLKKFVPHLISQNYPNYEIVLVNDASYDGTREIIEEFEEKYPNLIKAVQLNEYDRFRGSKKFALTMGIKASSNEHLIFTDADCQPKSQNWISEIVHSFKPNKEIVIGYGAYRTIEKSFLNKLIRFETLLTALQYFSYAKIGIPYMGVGRNLAYTKSLFFKNNGFGNHMHIKSGDDDLFINENGNKENVNLCVNQDSFTISEPKVSFKDWINQKRRHISTAKHYKTKHKALLGLFYMSQIGFWSLGLILLANQYFLWPYVLGLIFLRFIVQIYIFSKASKKLNEKKIAYLAPILDFFLVTIQFYIFILNKFSKPVRW